MLKRFFHKDNPILKTCPTTITNYFTTQLHVLNLLKNLHLSMPYFANFIFFVMSNLQLLVFLITLAYAFEDIEKSSYSFPHSILDQVLSKKNINAVLNIESKLAILHAILISSAKKTANTRVLLTAKSLHSSAFTRDRLISSAPEFLPNWDLFINRSPMNIVATFEKKSDPTIEKAVDSDPEKLSDERNVIEPPISLQDNAFATERNDVSRKFSSKG